MAVQRAAAVLDDDDISVDFSMAMPPTSPCTAQAFALGKAIVSVEVNNEPLPSMNDVHAICAQVAAVASVIPLDENSGRFTVEFNDSRDVLEAVSKLNDDSSGGQLAMSAMVAPAPTGHLVDLFHAAAKATTETSTTSQYKFTDSFESPSRREWGPTDPASTVGLSGKHPLLSEPSLYQTIAPTPPRSNESHGNQQNHRPSQVASAYPIASYGATPPTCTQTWSRHQQYSMAPHAAVPLRALPRPSYQYTSPFSPPVVATEYSLGIDRVHKGEDTRTTLMIRNIPNKYTQTMLLAEINHHGHHGSYDFFYLPIDFKNKCNMGYAFINFMMTDAIVPFYNAFNGQRWRNFNSEKVCAISYARLQGKAAMINRFQNSSVLDKHESYRPLVFKSFGPDKGKHEPFPAPRIKPRQVLDNAGPSSSPPRPSLYSAPPPSHHHHHNFRLYSTAGMYNGPTPLGRPAYPLYHQHHHVSDAGHWRSGAAAQIFSHSNGCSDDAADVSLGGTNGYLDAKHAPTAAPALPALHA
ncbi:hypothetical protein DYB32_005863 [Aphanomyces invadans]|uniref:Mei2-like C-terminal RNA recognition motif domain-containing protein n=1 Tax=Aphanomyces invadans TaxID=157072 RepID=A0A418ATB6_9STRA|nr:hypothetical protein DYB32_005863 [Aphanomyces invadans]